MHNHMHHDRPTPMTNAQRQQKHRAKRQRELEALRAVVPSSHDERELARQVQRLTTQLAQAHKAAAQQQERLHALQHEQIAAQAMREAWHTLLVKLSPAARHVAQTHAESCDAARWLDAPIT